MAPLTTFWLELGKREHPEVETTPGLALPVAPDDPLLPVLQTAPGAVGVEKLDLDSPLLRALHKAYVNLALPLVDDGDLIGLLNLSSYPGGRGQATNDVATSDQVAAPVVWVLQLADPSQPPPGPSQVNEQTAALARVIEHRLSEQRLPELPGWQLTAHFSPARDVGGDFYDFIPFDDGQLGIVVGDVTDKGMPAALIMVITRSVLRAAARELVAPGPVLAHANDLICADIPTHSFVTCLYALLDLSSGELRYANAGHTLPYRLRRNFSPTARVDALRATGMPLGLIPGLDYAERETMLIPGETVLFYSDGIVEARDPQGELYGFPRLQAALASAPDLDGAALMALLQQELAAFIGPDTEPEDDVGLVYLERSPRQSAPAHPGEARDTWRTLAEFSLPSERGNERRALAQVAQATQELDLSPAQVERLKTAVAEATMNAIQHGNQGQPELPVRVQVWVSQDEDYLLVRISDQARAPLPEFETPDLAAKLAGEQAPRGWGRFLMQSMVDEVRDVEGDARHTVELILFLPRGGANR